MQQLFRYIANIFRIPRQSRTVRFMFPALLTFAALFGTAAVITSEDVSYIRLQASDSVVEAGKPFSIDVYAYAHVPVNAVDITLQFDPNDVTVTGVDTGQSVITIWTEDPIIGDGTVVLRGGTYRRGFVSEHLIATVNLKAKQSGQSSLAASEVVLLAGDGEGTNVSVADGPNAEVSLYVYDENADPGSIGVNVGISIVTDIDGDGKVTLRDVSAFMAAWHNKSRIFDFNGDGRMTFRDFSIILADLFFN